MWLDWPGARWWEGCRRGASSLSVLFGTDSSHEPVPSRFGVGVELNIAGCFGPSGVDGGGASVERGVLVCLLVSSKQWTRPRTSGVQKSCSCQMRNAVGGDLGAVFSPNRAEGSGNRRQAGVFAQVLAGSKQVDKIFGSRKNHRTSAKGGEVRGISPLLISATSHPRNATQQDTAQHNTTTEPSSVPSLSRRNTHPFRPTPAHPPYPNAPPSRATFVPRRCHNRRSHAGADASNARYLTCAMRPRISFVPREDGTRCAYPGLFPSCPCSHPSGNCQLPRCPPLFLIPAKLFASFRVGSRRG